MHSRPSPDEIDRLFRSSAARAVATLARVFNDFDRAEEAVQDAYALAVERWPRDGSPKNPSAWIALTARNKAIDRLRREQLATAKGELLANLEALVHVDAAFDDERLDDRLAMICAACHPALAEETRVALTLRYAAGLTVAEIAAALVTPAPTIAQRLVRAKHKIGRARIAFAVPGEPELSRRIRDILRIIYLIFNEGYASSTHATRVRGDLCDEALRLAELFERLRPGEPEIAGLHALILFHDARRATRLDERGEPVLLEHQDRSRWDAAKIARASSLLAAIAPADRGPHCLQAMIAGEHARAPAWEQTNWRLIRGCYDVLLAIDPSPIVELNRAVAVAHLAGPEAGLSIVDRIAAGGDLETYGPLAAARAGLLRRAGRPAEAASAYRRAIELTAAESERASLQRRLAEVDEDASSPSSA